MTKRKILLRLETLRDLQVQQLRGDRQATNSSECGACSCEQHCEQVRK